MRFLLNTALCLWLGLCGTPLSAHALPGASLTIRAGSDATHLTVTLPLHELDLAMSEASGLGPAPAIGPVPQDAKARIALYLAGHLTLADAAGKKVDTSLTTARVERAHHDHVGNYNLLVLDLSAPAALLPLTLHYDAILHEVRNHRAAVYLQVPGADPKAIGVIRLDPASGKAPALVIPAP